MSHYADAVLDFRRRKDEHFAAGRGPVELAEAAEFRGLSYYAPDPAWAFRVPLTPLPQDAGAEFTLDTNTGQPRTMARYGTVTLSLPGGERTLSVFTPLGEDAPTRAFVPFRDATSGTETYGAGRYLDAPLQRGEGPDLPDLWIELDFNMAYHPYCAYSAGWTCPLPPRENWLPDPVRAGEKLPSGSA